MRKADQKVQHSQEWWNTLTTRRAVSQMLDIYDRELVRSARELTQTVVGWLALPLWKRAWLTLRRQSPFVGIRQAIKNAPAPTDPGEQAAEEADGEKSGLIQLSR